MVWYRRKNQEEILTIFSTVLVIISANFLPAHKLIISYYELHKKILLLIIKTFGI